MKKGLIIILCILLALALIGGGVVWYITNLPEYALIKMCEEVKISGFSAVEAHLTEDANKKIDPIRKITSNTIVSSILSFLSSENDYASILIEKAKEIEWTVGDILKNQRKASVTIGFNYDDKMIGKIDLELLKIEGEWKINDLYNLNVEKFEW